MNVFPRISTRTGADVAFPATPGVAAGFPDAAVQPTSTMAQAMARPAIQNSFFIFTFS
jgi:hypothetical protein